MVLGFQPILPFISGYLASPCAAAVAECKWRHTLASIVHVDHWVMEDRAEINENILLTAKWLKSCTLIPLWKRLKLSTDLSLCDEKIGFHHFKLCKGLFFFNWSCVSRLRTHTYLQRKHVGVCDGRSETHTHLGEPQQQRHNDSIVQAAAEER